MIGAIGPILFGIFDDFCAKFPYNETDDQQNAINDVLSDLALGKPMDRLICGDVKKKKTADNFS